MIIHGRAPACLAFLLLGSSCATVHVVPRRLPALRVGLSVSETATQDQSLPEVEVDSSAPHYGVFDIAEDAWGGSDVSKRYGERSFYREDISPRGVARSARDLVQLLRASRALATGNGPFFRDRLIDRLSDLQERASAERADPFNLVNSEFRPKLRTVDKGTDKERVSSMAFFHGTPQEFVVREYPMKDGNVPGIKVRGEAMHYATIEQAIEVRTVFDIVEDIFAEIRKAPFVRVSAKLESIDRGWSNYLERGYSQYPWESLVNSTLTPALFGDFSWYDPPANQLVVLHPEIGVVLDTRSTRGEVEGALLVHGLGYVRYLGSEREWFIGASSTVSFAGNDAGIGYGPTVHFAYTGASSVIPNLSVSVLWQDYETGGNGPVIALNVDLWRLFSSGSSDLFRSALR